MEIFIKIYNKLYKMIWSNNIKYRDLKIGLIKLYLCKNININLNYNLCKFYWEQIGTALF